MAENSIISPLISVLMPVYNAEKYLNQAIESILKQTFQDFEFIIIDDGSTDRSIEIIQTYEDTRIKFFKNQKNLGIAKTLNSGIQKAQGKYIARMDADDISLPERLEKQYNFLENNPQVALVATTIQLIDELGNPKGFWQAESQNIDYQQIKNQLPISNCISHPSILIKTEIIKRHQYVTYQPHAEDYDLWLRLINNQYEIRKLDEILVHYRIHNQSITQRNLKGQNSQKKNILVKIRFLCAQILQFKFTKFEFKISKQIFKEINIFYLKRYFSTQYQRLTFFKNFLFFSLNLHRFQFLLHLIFTKPKKDIFFFFPSYHFGGAEKVHTQITQCFANQRISIFFTRHSWNKGMKNNFLKTAQIFDISGNFVRNEKQRLVLAKLLCIYINFHKPKIVFGANSVFFYDLLPYLNPKITKIDLIHAFGTGIEQRSLSQVSLLHKRIINNRKTYDNLKKQYIDNQLDNNYLNRIIEIENYVNIPITFPSKTKKENLEAIYVGRNAEEKRIYLILKIAELAEKQDIKTDFKLIGDFSDEKDKFNISPNLKIIGEVSEEDKFNIYYTKSAILLITSSREGFPISVMEAMANGVVPICTDVGGISEKITHRQNGFLIDNPEDEENVVQKTLLYIEELQNNRNLLKEISENAYQYAKTHFNKENFEKAYRELLL